MQQFDDDIPGGQDYAIAWWAVSAVSGTAQGDFDSSGIVDLEDYNVWREQFGTMTAQADGNGDGVVDAADYVVWRKCFDAMAGSGGVGANVPEPGSGLFLQIAAAMVSMCRGGKQRLSCRRAASIGSINYRLGG